MRRLLVHIYQRWFLVLFSRIFLKKYEFLLKQENPNEFSITEIAGQPMYVGEMVIT